MGLWRSLTRRRTIPEVPTWIAATALLAVAAYAGWAAVRPEGPPIMQNRDPADLFRESRDLVAHGESLMQAMRDHDRDRVEELHAALQARSRREAEREGKRAAAVMAARAWFGVIAAVSFAVGLSLLVAAQRSRPE